MNFEIVSNDGEMTVTVVDDAGTIHPPVHETNPNFKKIIELCLLEGSSGNLGGEEYEMLIDLLDLSKTVTRKFERLSERVTVANGQVYFDGDVMNSALSNQIMRFLDENVDDWKPLVLFFEKVQSNPNEHSREQLFDWLQAHDFTITDKGDIIGYKGVEKVNGELLSIYSGHAIVNGEDKNGKIPNEVGYIVEMPRSEVAHSPSEACSSGLHVGTYRYASGYARGAMLKVEVNPRDVVSVPTDAAGEKVRVCRYQVVEVIDAPETSAVVRSYDERPASYWGDGEDWDGDDETDYDDETDNRCSDPNCPSCNPNEDKGEFRTTYYGFFDF